MFLIFIPYQNLENVTKRLTDEFLRQSLTKNKGELMVYIPMIILQVFVSTLGLFIFSIIFFHKVNQIALKLSEWMKIAVFSSMSIIGPFLGLLIGGYTLSFIKRKKSDWIIFFYSFIGLGFCILFNKMDSDVLIQNVYLGGMLFFYSSSLPMIYSSISNMIISNETRKCLISVMVLSNNLFGLGFGSFIGGFFFDIIDKLLFYLGIAFYPLFILFFIVYMVKLHGQALHTDEFFEYQLFLLISYVFSKFSLFIWGDYLGESIVKRLDQSFSVQIKRNVDVLEGVNFLPEANDANEEGTNSNSNNSDPNRPSNRPSQMTFDQGSSQRVTFENLHCKETFLFEANDEKNRDFSFKNNIFEAPDGN